MRVHNTMMLQEAKLIARHLGLTLRRVRSVAYRVNFPDRNGTAAYYTNDLEDAVNTAVEMARTRSAREPIDVASAVRQVPSHLQALSDGELWQL
jgi:DNA-binding transcriptional regulator YbjK